MNNETKKGKLVPELRFPGFEGEWEEKKLGEVADSIVVGFPFKSEDLTNDNAGVLILRGLSIGEGCIKHGGEYDKYYTGETNSLKKYILHRDDIVMGMDGSIGRNIALVTKKEDNSLLIQRVARIRISKYPLHLIYQQIMSQRFKDYVCSEKVGAVIAHISQKQIENFPILVAPQKAEQQKITECLSSVDDLIQAEADQLQALKDHKKGLMQQLFPQEGETTPKLRFSGFEGEWEEKKLGDVGDVCMCKRIMKYETSSKGAVPFYKIGTFGKKADAFISEDLFLEYKGKYSYPKKGDILFSAAGTIGRCVVFDGASAYFQDSNIVWIANNESIVYNSFLKYIYTFVDWKIDDGGVVKRLYNDSIRKTTFYAPSLPEQQKIADCISSLDEGIAAQQRKVEALREHKKGLMQKLFPTIN